MDQQPPLVCPKTIHPTVEWQRNDTNTVVLVRCERRRVVYAYPTGNIFPLFSVCVFAEFMSILYIIFYAYHCDNRVYVAKAVGLGLVVFVPVTVYLILAEVDVIHQTDSQVGDILGYLAVAMNFVLYLSPLEKVKQVLVTKSAASIPVLMSSAIGFNSLLWFVTGVVDHDIYLLASNAVGTVLSATQVVLYFIYRPGRHSSAPATGDPSKEALQVDLEMQELATRGSPRSPAFQPLASPLAPIRP